MGLKGITNFAVKRAENFVNKAENKIKKSVKTAEKITNKQVNSFVKNVSSQINGNYQFAKNFVPPIPVPKPAKKLGFIDKLFDKGKNFFEKVVSFGSNALDFGKKVFNEFKNRAKDIGRSALNLVTEGLGGFGRSIFEGSGKILSGAAKILNPAPLGKLLSGDFKGALKDFKNNVFDGAKKIGDGLVQGLVQGPVSTFIVGLQNAVSAIQTATGLEPAGRGLTNSEKAELKKVYGDSLDVSKIRIKEGNIGLNNFLAPHTIGNTIYLPKNSTKNLSDDQLKALLVHEAAHTWQYQNGGIDYIGASIWNQLKGVVSGGDRGLAYEFTEPLKEGKKWKDLNPEQQASLIETAYRERFFDNQNARYILTDGTDLTQQMRDAIQEMLNGKGAA